MLLDGGGRWPCSFSRSIVTTETPLGDNLAHRRYHGRGPHAAAFDLHSRFQLEGEHCANSCESPLIIDRPKLPGIFVPSFYRRWVTISFFDLGMKNSISSPKKWTAVLKHYLSWELGSKTLELLEFTARELVTDCRSSETWGGGGDPTEIVGPQTRDVGPLHCWFQGMAGWAGTV